MTLSGFCRNCLAKWLVREARTLAAELRAEARTETKGEAEPTTAASTIQALDALGYDEAAEHVYGCAYPEWKERHAAKASDEQMARYGASKPLHASHDKELLAVRAGRPRPTATAAGPGAAPAAAAAAAAAPGGKSKSSLLSDVCCEDVESAARCRPTTAPSAAAAAVGGKSTVPPPSGDMSVTIGILTVSDRAAAGQYETGDLSGPAVEQSVDSLVAGMSGGGGGGSISHTVIHRDIVPDDAGVIATKLKEWAARGDSSCDLIFTTGGTGFSPRDVTPEATRSVLDKESHGLMAYVSSECSEGQPLAALSRGTAGMRGNTLIVNLPGSPAGVRQTMGVLFPLLLHAVKDIKMT